MRSTFRLPSLVLALALAGSALPAAAQEIDQSDVAFWQSIQSSQNPEEFKAYLQAFPNGVFAELAEVRLKGLGGAAPAPGGEDASAPLSDAVLTISPDNPRVGDTLTLATSNMPTPGSGDILAVVAAGTPDSVDRSFKPGIIKWDFAAYNANGQQNWQIGQLPPGAYEVRWLTELYNTEGRPEVGARQSFEVSR